MPEIVLQRIGRSEVIIPVVGTAPLIMHRFSTKAKAMMLSRQMGEAIQREPKNPEELYRESMYTLPPLTGEEEERYGYPAPGFKAAIVNAARYFKGSKGLTMELLKQAVFVRGEGKDMLVVIDGKPEMVEHNVRNETGVADIRFRAQFWPWTATLHVIYVASLLRAQSVVALVDAAGLNGVGEWRPGSKTSKTGTYGTFQVPDDAEIKELKEVRVR